MKLLMCLLLSLQVFADVELQGNPEFKFTGYKFSEKTGVSGNFKSMDWKIKKGAKSLSELIVNTTVKVDAYSVDANDKLRNLNITNSLFKNWGGRYIDVKFVEVNEKIGFVKSQITIGDKTSDVYFQMNKNDKDLIFTGSIDLLQMGYASAFESLSSLCKNLHTGKDKISKTWSTVDISVLAKIK